MDKLNVMTGAVVAASVRIHRLVGPGLLESVFEVVVARDLARLERLINFGMATMKAGIRRIAN